MAEADVGPPKSQSPARARPQSAPRARATPVHKPERPKSAHTRSLYDADSTQKTLAAYAERRARLLEANLMHIDQDDILEKKFVESIERENAR